MSAIGVRDQNGEPVTQERWDSVWDELQRLRAARPLRILRIREVVQRVGLQKTQLYEKMEDGSFPCAIKISERAVGWLEHEIDEYLAIRMAERPASAVQRWRRPSECL